MVRATTSSVDKGAGEEMKEKGQHQQVIYWSKSKSER